MSQQKRSAQKFALALLSLTASIAFGDTSPTATTATPSVTATATAPSPGGVFGMIDIRPSLSATGNNSWVENAVEAGYAFNPNVKLSYLAAFDNNIADGSRPGFIVKMWDGFFRMRVKNILVSEDKSLSLSYQGRLYTPNDPNEQAKGEITALRSYLTVAKKFSDSLTVTLSQVPILHLYSKAGNGNVANRSLYENELILDATVQIAGPVSFYLPFVFFVGKNQNYFAGAKKNDSTTGLFYLYPELDITLNAIHTVGLSYYSGNLMRDNLSAFTLADGLKGGVLQLFWTAML